MAGGTERRKAKGTARPKLPADMLYSLPQVKRRKGGDVEDGEIPRCVKPRRTPRRPELTDASLLRDYFKQHVGYELSMLIGAAQSLSDKPGRAWRCSLSTCGRFWISSIWMRGRPGTRT